MASFKSVIVVNKPVASIWCTVRDRMSEIASSLDDVESISVLERTVVNSETVHLVNEWRARNLPRMVLDRFGTDHVGWIDDAFWSDTDWKCSWTITPNILPGNVRCAGQTTYESAINGKGAKVIFQGTLELDAGRVASTFGLPGRVATSIVETIITTMIPRNFRKIVNAAVTLIQQTENSMCQGPNCGEIPI